MAYRLIIKAKNNSQNICRNPTQMPYIYNIKAIFRTGCVLHIICSEKIPQNNDFLIIHITRILEENWMISRRK